MGESSEARKVQITGKSTHIISLPKRWVKRVNIQGGDLVTLVPRSDGTLLLNPLGEGRPKRDHTLVIELKDDLPAAERAFTAAYLAGWEQIEFVAATRLEPATRQLLVQMLRGLIGPEVVEERPNALVVRVLTDRAQFTPLQGIRRLHTVAHDMVAAAVQAMVHTDDGAAAAVQARRPELTKLDRLVYRQCQSAMRDLFYADQRGLEPQDAMGFICASRGLAQIGDAAAALAALTRPDRPSSSEALKLVIWAERVLEQMDGAVVDFYQDRLAHAQERVQVLDRLGSGIREARDLALGAEKDFEGTASLAELLDRMARCVTDIVDAAILQHHIRLIREN